MITHKPCVCWLQCRVPWVHLLSMNSDHTMSSWHGTNLNRSTAFHVATSSATEKVNKYLSSVLADHYLQIILLYFMFIIVGMQPVSLLVFLFTSKSVLLGRLDCLSVCCCLFVFLIFFFILIHHSSIWRSAAFLCRIALTAFLSFWGKTPIPLPTTEALPVFFCPKVLLSPELLLLPPCRIPGSVTKRHVAVALAN